MSTLSDPLGDNASFQEVNEGQVRRVSLTNVKSASLLGYYELLIAT
jgi:hypothetical protein